MIKVSSEIKIYEIKVENAFASTVLFIVRISSLSFSFSFVVFFFIILNCLCSKYSPYPPDNSNLQGKSKKVRVIGSSKKIAGSWKKTVFFCVVNILITFDCRNVK